MEGSGETEKDRKNDIPQIKSINVAMRPTVYISTCI